MIYFLLSIPCACWFYRELYRFPIQINRQTYQDMQSLIALPFSLAELLQCSTLQAKNNPINKILFILLPLVALLFQQYPITILLMLFILSYLAILDYNYYLTDIRYIAYIFLFSIANLLFFDNLFLYEKLFCLFFCLGFFALFIPLTKLIYKKEVFGLGDAILLIAISPIFQMEQMLILLLTASLSGIFYYCIYWLIKKQKLIKLPFVPFISFAVIVLLFVNN